MGENSGNCVIQSQTKSAPFDNLAHYSTFSDKSSKNFGFNYKILSQHQGIKSLWRYFYDKKISLLFSELNLCGKIFFSSFDNEKGEEESEELN